MLQVSNSKDFFTRHGRGFFYLADTVWAAFTNPHLEEWEEYLDYRRLQGFNALQINILPQWDRSMDPVDLHPFALKEDGSYDFGHINDAYFHKAQTMLEMAQTRGFTPALVLLWCDFVKDTWAANRMPDHVMPLTAVEPYVRYCVDAFASYNPVYLVSGDTNFPSDEAVEYYYTALRVIKEEAPTSLTTLHLQPKAVVPERLVECPYLDFFMYQSGHNLEGQDLPYELAHQFLSSPVRRPVVNGEPCYEGHGHGNRYGRFGAFDIRKAIWQSLLAGAKAGVTYGAHGIWSFHRSGQGFPSTSFSSYPYDWRVALRFDGAWDAAFAKWVFETYDLFSLEPSDHIEHASREVRLAMTPDQTKVALYVPYSTEVKVTMDLSGYDWTMIDLSTRYPAQPNVDAGRDSSLIAMHPFTEDVLVLGRKSCL